MQGLNTNDVVCFVTLAVLVMSLEIFTATQSMDKIKALGELFKVFARLFR